MKSIRKINDCLLERASECGELVLGKLKKKEHRCAIKVTSEQLEILLRQTLQLNGI